MPAPQSSAAPSRAALAAALLLGAVIMVNVGPAVALPPPMLRTACGLVADAEEMVGNKALAAGKMAVDFALKPIAIVGGLKAAAVGTGMKVGGGAIKLVGEKMVKDGAIIQATGAGVKGAGLGVAALGLKPAAEKIMAASQGAEAPINAAKNFANGLGESSLQIDATFDSPVLGHHHKEVNVTASDKLQQHALLHQETKGQQAEQQPQQQQQLIEQQIVQQNSVTKRAASKIDPEVMKSAMNLVKEARMEDCVARAICDLNCNPQGFGQDGKQVFMNMVRLQGANVLEQSESKYFHEAAANGRKFSSKCEQCSSHYSKCNSKSADLIKMASHIKMD